MSRFDDLDHRLGRHDGKPHPDCSVCNPDIPSFTAARANAPWDYEGWSPPAFPDWGTIWNHRGELVTFVNPNQGKRHPEETDARNVGGFWTPIHNGGALNKKDPTPMSTVWTRTEIQMEMGSGKWHPRVKHLAINNTIPDEAGLTSPLGVNLVQWAKDQNHAKIVVEMARQHLFPIDEIQHDRRTKPIIASTIIESSVMTIEMEPLAGLLSTTSLR